MPFSNFIHFVFVRQHRWIRSLFVRIWRVFFSVYLLTFTQWNHDLLGFYRKVIESSVIHSLRMSWKSRLSINVTYIRCDVIVTHSTFVCSCDLSFVGINWHLKGAFNVINFSASVLCQLMHCFMQDYFEFQLRHSHLKIGINGFQFCIVWQFANFSQLIKFMMYHLIQ